MKFFLKSFFRIIIVILFSMCCLSCDSNDGAPSLSSPFGPKKVVKETITFDCKIDTEIEIPDNIKALVPKGLDASTTDFKEPLLPDGKVISLELCEMPIELRDTEIKNGILWTKNYGKIDVLLVGIKEGESVFELRATPEQIGIITKDVIKYEDNRRELFTAVLDNDIPRLKSLVDAKVELNVRSVDDITPLIAAAVMNQLEVLRILLEAGADVNARDHIGWTALIHSASENNSEAAEILIKAHADINAGGIHGTTALIMATEKGNIALVKALVEAGADLNASAETAGKKSTALQIAESKGFSDIAELLKKAGAE